MVRILLGHNGSNRCETVICCLEAQEGEKISVKRGHTCSVSGSLGALVVSTSPVCTEWGPTHLWHLSCMMSWSQKRSHCTCDSNLHSTFLYISFTRMIQLVTAVTPSKHILLTQSFAHFLLKAFSSPSKCIISYQFLFSIPLTSCKQSGSCLT